MKSARFVNIGLLLLFWALIAGIALLLVNWGSVDCEFRYKQELQHGPSVLMIGF